MCFSNNVSENNHVKHKQTLTPYKVRLSHVTAGVNNNIYVCDWFEVQLAVTTSWGVFITPGLFLLMPAVMKGLIMTQCFRLSLPLSLMRLLCCCCWTFVQPEDASRQGEAWTVLLHLVCAAQKQGIHVGSFEWGANIQLDFALRSLCRANSASWFTRNCPAYWKEKWIII